MQPNPPKCHTRQQSTKSTILIIKFKLPQSSAQYSPPLLHVQYPAHWNPNRTLQGHCDRGTGSYIADCCISQDVGKLVFWIISLNIQILLSKPISNIVYLIQYVTISCILDPKRMFSWRSDVSNRLYCLQASFIMYTQHTQANTQKKQFPNLLAYATASLIYAGLDSKFW